MDKQHSSRLINVYTGGDADTMFCARCYVQQKLYGGFWIPLSVSIDICFYVIRREREHVRATYLLQRRQDAQAVKSPARAPQEEAGTQQTEPSCVADVLQRSNTPIQWRL